MKRQDGRTRFTDTVTLTMALTLAATVTLGSPTDTVAHWFARTATAATAAWYAAGWWHHRHRS